MTATKRLLLFGCGLYIAKTVLALIINICTGNFSTEFASSVAAGSIIILIFGVDLLTILLPSVSCFRRDFSAQRKTPAIVLFVVCLWNCMSDIVVFIAAIPDYLTLNKMGIFSLIMENFILSLDILSLPAIILLLIACVRCLCIPKNRTPSHIK